MPVKVKHIAKTIIGVIFSLKNTEEITATIIGYTNKIVHAIPDGIKLKAVNKVSDENENKIANKNKEKPCLKSILKEFFLTNLIYKP